MIYARKKETPTERLELSTPGLEVRCAIQLRQDGFSLTVLPSLSLKLSVHTIIMNINIFPIDQLSDEHIDAMVATRRVPAELADERVDEPNRARPILFRRTAGPVRVTLFDGGHNGDITTAIRWLAEQTK